MNRPVLTVVTPAASLDFAESLLVVSLRLLEDDDYIACRRCGCTNFAACPGGCEWVQHDLCSACPSDSNHSPQ